MITVSTVILMAMQKQAVDLKPGMVIDRTCTIRRRVYSLPSGDDAGKSGAITITGNGIVVDFDGAVIMGTPNSTMPSERKGTAIVVKGRGITIKNAVIRGYKIGIIARNCPGIKILNCDLSYNWKQHLLSNLEREDLSDWLSYHRNENDEWLRYGCGVYLRKCDGFEVKGMTCTGGQNGLMLMECDKGKVWNCDLSFLSGCGLAMYLSSDNRIMHNKIDWCVRGYSHGVYNRGQDSAGIIIYEQSSRNVFAFNSATHGGDGFFLWAGQSTMDTGQGGCNDNLLYGNDFSGAPANGIEMTFSRNTVVNNLMDECWHGIWGGYSYDSKIIGNTFSTSDEHIAIEHGMNNAISDNLFIGCSIGINLWWDKVSDDSWGYPKKRDTRSLNNLISRNSFAGVKTPISLRNTQKTRVEVNLFCDDVNPVAVAGDFAGTEFIGNTVHGTLKPLAGIATSQNRWLPTDRAPKPAPRWDPFRPVSEASKPYAVTPLKGGMDPFIKPGQIRGRKYILVNEWGPVDFKSPVLWPRGTEQKPDAKGRMQEWHKFEIVGPKGTWRVKEMRGIQQVSVEHGQAPGFISILPSRGAATDLFLQLEFTGEPIVTPLGEKIPQGNPYLFSYSEFFAPIDWKVEWFKWDDATDPRKNLDAFEALLKTKPIKTETIDRLNYEWGGAIGEGLPGDYFATHAVGQFEVPKGTYVLEFVADDGIRAWLDGKLILDEWHWQPPTPYSRTVELNGKHRIEIQHFEIDGYAALKMSLKPKR